MNPKPIDSHFIHVTTGARREIVELGWSIIGLKVALYSWSVIPWKLEQMMERLLAEIGANQAKTDVNLYEIIA
jgi:hypothetical protein